MEFSKNCLQATTKHIDPKQTDPKPNILTPAISQNRFTPLSIELENTWKNNNSDSQSNYDHGANNYIKKTV